LRPFPVWPCPFLRQSIRRRRRCAGYFSETTAPRPPPPPPREEEAEEEEEEEEEVVVLVVGVEEEEEEAGEEAEGGFTLAFRPASLSLLLAAAQPQSPTHTTSLRPHSRPGPHTHRCLPLRHF